MADPRREEIAENLAAVRKRIAAACTAAGRDPAEITLVAVTKTYPAADVRHLAALGVSNVGENRDQEAAPKAAEVADPSLCWHFIGQLQRNKCRSVVTYADMVQSVDGIELARTLADQAAKRRDRPLDVLLQVSLDDDPSRGGALKDDLPRLAEVVTNLESLRLRGIMAVAPATWDPRAAFEKLNQCTAMIRTDYPDATVVSAGMSGDLDTAIACGATHVRIGSALLGMRIPLR